MRECDRCGKKIKYGTLCHDCDIYLTSFCAGNREGRRVAVEEERERIVSLIHEFFSNELDKLETDYDGIDEYYTDTKKVDELLSMNKRLCEIVRRENGN